MTKTKTLQQTLFNVSEVNWEAETKHIIQLLRNSGALMAYIDLFCGAGGTSTGVERAMYLGRKLACVILGINHDKMAIESHKANHPSTLHLIEDIRDVNLAPIKKMIAAIRKELPYIKIVLWASAECTHHSKANGGASRDADSRSLPEELYRYQEALKPDYIQVENVTEFRIWGPLQHKYKAVADLHNHKHVLNHPEFGKLYSNTGKNWIDENYYWYRKEKKEITPWMVPIPERKKEFFNEWVNHLKDYGLYYEDKDLNSANFGAYTSRNRYFGQFARKGNELRWPKPTHAKSPTNGLKPYRPVREVLDLHDKGESIFKPGKITSDNSFKRFLEGCIKFIAGGKKEYAKFKEQYEDFSFIANYHAGAGRKDTRTHSIEEPNRTVDTQNRYAFTSVEFSKDVSEVVPFIVQFNNNCDANSVDEPNKTLTAKDKFAPAFVQFISQYNTGKSMAVSIDRPARTITTSANQAVVEIDRILPFICAYHGSGTNWHTVANPSPVVAANDGLSLASPEPFIFRQFGNGGGHFKSAGDPAGSVTTNPKMNLMTPEGWILNPSFDNTGSSLENPMHTLLASRKHAYIVNPSYGGHSSDIENPSPVVVARQDKAPLHLCQVEFGEEKCYGIVIYKTDSEAVKELKRFMAMYGIVDIKMRMLKVNELLKIQGFGDYKLKGSQSDQKKFIGNSVECNTAQSLVECYGEYLTQEFQKYQKLAA